MKTDLTINDCISMVKERGYGDVSRQTIYTWLSKYGLGIKVGGRWKKIDRDKFNKFLDGERNNGTKSTQG